MRVLEREKAELAVMQEKVVGSRSSEGKRKVFDHSQIPGLSPSAEGRGPVASAQRFDNIEVPKYRGSNLDEIAEEEEIKAMQNANMRSPGIDSPLHSPMPHYATPQQPPQANPSAAHLEHELSPGGENATRRNLFQHNHEIQDEDLPPSVKKRLEILSTMRENKRRQMSHNSFWSVENDPRIVSPQKLHQKKAEMYKKGGFLSAMRDLQGGPSEEQRRIAELQRQKLLQDLDEQVRLKREEKRSEHMKRKLQEEQAERRARLDANRPSVNQPRSEPPPRYQMPQPSQPAHHMLPMQERPVVSHELEDQPSSAYSAPSVPHVQHRPPPVSHYQPPVHEVDAPSAQYHQAPPIQVAPRVLAASPPPPVAAGGVYRSPVIRARRRYEIEASAQGSASAVLPMQQNPAVIQPIPSARSPGLAHLHHRAAEAGAPQNDAISALLSEIRHEQKMLRQQFQEQMHVVSKLEQGARNASKDHEVAMSELRRVKENILVDALDEFSVASHYVPKDCAQIPEDSRLSEIEIRMATAGKPYESFDDALNGFLITRESVYLNQDEEEPTLSPIGLKQIDQGLDFPPVSSINDEAHAYDQEDALAAKPKPRAKTRRKKRTAKPNKPQGRWRM